MSNRELLPAGSDFLSVCQIKVIGWSMVINSVCNFSIQDTKEPEAKSTAKHKMFREKLVGAQAKNATWPHYPLTFSLSSSSPEEAASSSSMAFLLDSVERI